MSSIDERIVSMKFNNDQFETGVKTTLSSLDKLKQGLSLDGAKKGLEELQRVGSNFGFTGLANGLDHISGKFVAMAAVGIAVLNNIANSAIAAGKTLISSLTIDPVKAGLQEYETNLNAIQTILANTQSKGTTLDNVNEALRQLNEYSDKTIYNFSEMARNIGTFTAAGVSLDTSVNAIKGIANLAALSGSNSQQASTAMYQLSQALSTGTVKLMDWNSVVNAGMGGQVFQDAIKETARVHGVAVDSIIEEQGSFRDSLQTGWLTSEILTETLSKLTGDLTDQQLEAMGYTQEQIIGIQKMAKTASDAATKVKTMSQLIGTLQEAAGSGWSQTWQLIFGDFEEAKELFTGVNDVLGGMIGKSADARNAMFQVWRDAGGREKAIEAVSNAFHALMNIITPIKSAFQDIFPPMTGTQLAVITGHVRDFTKSLIPSGETMALIKRTAAGFFAVLDIGWMIIKEVAGVFGRLFGVVGEGTGSFLEITANVGDFLVKIRDAIKSGDGLGQVFKFIGDMLVKPLKLLQDLAAITWDWIDVQSWADAWDKVVGVFQAIWTFVKPAVDWVVEGFKKMGEAIKGFFAESDPSMGLGLLNVGLFTAFSAIILKFTKGFPDLLAKAFGGLGGGIVDTIKNVFGTLTETLKTMQMKIKAEALQKIAIAVAILTAAVIALSFIDPVALGVALAAIAVMFTELGLALGILNSKIKITDTKQIATVVIAINLLAGAMLLLATALVIMGTLDIAEMGIALLGLSVGLGAMVGALKLLSMISAPVLAGAAALMIASIGLLALAGALKILSTIKWEELWPALVGLAGALGILAVGLTLMSASGLGAVALLLASVALLALAGALKVLALLSWDEVGKTMAILGASLGILAVGLTLMYFALPGAAALLVAAAALIVLGAALKIMASLSWDEVGKAMALLAASLGILAVGLTLMVFALPGAAALVVVSAALLVLLPVLVALGAMSWEQIGTGLAMLGATLGILALAGVALLPAIPGLIGLGVAVALIGVGALAAGVGIGIFALGLAALAGAGAAALAMIGPAIQAFAAQIPLIALKVGEGIIVIAGVIAANGVAILDAITTVLLALVQAIVDIVPPLVDAAVLLITKLVEALIILIPLLVDAGLQIVIGILDGIAKNIGKVIEKGTDLIVAFLDGIGKAIPRVLQAGADLILDFLNGIANTIRNNNKKFQDAGMNIADAIIDGMTSGITNGVTTVINSVKKMADSAINAAKKALGIKSPSKEFTEIGEFTTEGMAIGMTKLIPMVDTAGAKVGKAAIDSVKKSLSTLGSAVSADVDFQPVIRPVLDLSAIKKDASLIGSTLGQPTLSLDNMRASAGEAAVGYEGNMQARTDADGTISTGDTYNFTQNNTSPKALAPAEIYRQTKNQLSVVKGEKEK